MCCIIYSEKCSSKQKWILRKVSQHNLNCFNMRDYNRITKPTPEQYCAYCGKKLERKRINGRLEDLGAFKRRLYCGRDCMRRGFVKRDAASQKWGESHHSARKIIYLIEQREKVCELCGSTRNIDVHHKDCNYQNNESDNLMLVCRSCHMKIHRNKMFIETEDENQQLSLF